MPSMPRQWESKQFTKLVLDHHGPACCSIAFDFLTNINCKFEDEDETFTTGGYHLTMDGCIQEYNGGRVCKPGKGATCCGLIGLLKQLIVSYTIITRYIRETSVWQLHRALYFGLYVLDTVGPRGVKTS